MRKWNSSEVLSRGREFITNIYDSHTIECIRSAISKLKNHRSSKHPWWCKRRAEFQVLWCRVSGVVHLRIVDQTRSRKIYHHSNLYAGKLRCKLFRRCLLILKTTRFGWRGFFMINFLFWDRSFDFHRGDECSEWFWYKPATKLKQCVQENAAKQTNNCITWQKYYKYSTGIFFVLYAILNLGGSDVLSVS